MGCRRLIFGTALLVVLLAAYIFARGVVNAAHAVMLSASGRVAPGRVVDRVISGGVRKSVYPILEFTSADGQQHRFTSPISGSGVPALIGEAVEIRYDPSAPDHAAVNTFTNLYMPAIIPIAFAIFPLGALGAVFLWFTRFGADSDDVRTNRSKWVPSWFPP